MYDDNLSTAWRCDGSAVGQTITFALPPNTRIAEVGLVNGYAKVDPDQRRSSGTASTAGSPR